MALKLVQKDIDFINFLKQSKRTVDVIRISRLACLLRPQQQNRKKKKMM